MASRPKRILPADTAVTFGPQLKAVGAVLNDAAGFNLTLPFNLDIAGVASVDTVILDLSGYTSFSLLLTVSRTNGIGVDVVNVDPATGLNAAVIATGLTTGVAATPSVISFGGGTAVAVGTLVLARIRLKAVGVGVASITTLTGLNCGVG